ncbi:PH domain-containing protein [Wenzhouxiangella sp. XN79A]|uniref:PH domain-containing protein n=1 Tax=Wenzhouxiangella sp. XN79A TaxID=2724193 RepID=UPI00144AF9D8|nr:PH domain-containing protein [Wenzhouxiangella sp. XN79A]NKI33566.1 PH domain-containing protein [Wenzhouxiangella sp. XN79A]
MRPAPRVLRTAEISPQAIRYSMISFTLTMIATIVGILLLPIALPIAWWYYRRFYATLEVVLTSRELQVSRGVLIRQEKSIPLEKVTDLALIQGPIMRRMDIKGLQVETAGQSSTPGGALVKLIGIIDTDGFRDDALDQRDKVTDRPDAGPAAPEPSAGDTGQLLTEIRDTLKRIDARLAERG